MKKTELTETSNQETVTVSRVEYEEQQRRIAKLEQQVSVLTEALRLSRHKQFGTSSEKTNEEVMEQLSFLFNEAEVFAEAKAESENVVVVPEHKRHKKHEYTLDEANLPENTPTEVVEHTLEGEALECPQCGDTMTDIGVEVVKKLKIKSVELVVEEHRYL